MTASKLSKKPESAEAAVSKAPNLTETVKTLQFLAHEQGHVTYKGGNGPFKYNPKEVRDWLANRFGEVKHPDAASPDKKT